MEFPKLKSFYINYKTKTMLVVPNVEYEKFYPLNMREIYLCSWLAVRKKLFNGRTRRQNLQSSSITVTCVS